MTIKKKYDRVVAIDLGNGLVNVRSVYTDGSPYTFTLPSAFAESEQVGDSIGGVGAKYDVQHFIVDGVSYVWGKDVARLSNLTHTASSSESRYKTKNYRILVKIILGKVAKDIGISPNEQIFISTGVPSNQTSEEVANLIKDAFYGDSDKYKGLFKLSVDGEEYTVNVGYVNVTSQPLATVFSYYLDENGDASNEEITEKEIAVIDIGGGTTDFDTLREFNRLEYRSEPFGFRDVYHAIRKKIEKENRGRKIDVNDYEILDIIQKAEIKAKEEGTEPVYTYKGSDRQPEVDFTDEYNKALNKLGMQINEAISNQWKDLEQYDIVFLVGGSARRVQKYIDLLEDPTIPTNPGLSNVEGYYRYGVYLMREMMND